MKKKIAVFVSGGGTNLQALLDAQAAGKIPHGEITLVISNNPGAYALERARRAGVSGTVITKKECGAFSSELLDAFLPHLDAYRNLARMLTESPDERVTDTV